MARDTGGEGGGGGGGPGVVVLWVITLLIELYCVGILDVEC